MIIYDKRWRAIERPVNNCEDHNCNFKECPIQVSNSSLKIYIKPSIQFRIFPPACKNTLRLPFCRKSIISCQPLGGAGQGGNIKGNEALKTRFMQNKIASWVFFWLCSLAMLMITITITITTIIMITNNFRQCSHATLLEAKWWWSKERLEKTFTSLNRFFFLIISIIIINTIIDHQSSPLSWSSSWWPGYGNHPSWGTLKQGCGQHCHRGRRQFRRARSYLWWGGWGW